MSSNPATPGRVQSHGCDPGPLPALKASSSPIDVDRVQSGHAPLEAPLTEDATEDSEDVLSAEARAVRPATPGPSANEHPAPAPASVQETEAEREISYWKSKAIHLDNLVFEMRALLQSGKGFSEIMNIDDLLKALMAVCRERYGAINSAVLLQDDLDPDHLFYRVRGFYGLAPRYVDSSGEREELLLFKIPRDEGMLWQLIGQGDVFSVRDMRKRPRFRTAFKRWKLDVLNADIFVPLMRGAHVLGVLTLGECDDGSQIPEPEYAFLQEIAAVAATNIDSTLKYEKNARILSNLRTLYDINQQLANVNDFKRLTIETLATAVDALSAQKANLMLYNRDTERLEIKVVWGNIPTHVRDRINNGQMETKSFRIGEGVAGQAAQQMRPVRINDWGRIDQVGRNIAYCILAAPLIYGGEVMGVMTLTNKIRQIDGKLQLDPLGRFGEDDEQLLLGLTDQAAVNLHKARLYAASITDRMTGLHNTRHFEASIDEGLKRAHDTGVPLTLAITDIDHFKKFNDAHGHKAGDAVLVETARILRSMVREGSFDGAFRYGGEEFCLVLPDCGAEESAEILEEFRRRVEATEVLYGEKTLRVTVSVGIADTTHGRVTRNSLFEAADEALYASKDSGRNQVSVVVGKEIRQVERKPALPPLVALLPATPDHAAGNGGDR